MAFRDEGQVERHARLREVFHRVSELPPDRRAEAVREACAGDEAMLREIEALLRDSDTGDFDGALARAIGSAIDPPRAVAEPLSIPGYGIRGLVGRGGMGLVYEAWDEQLARRVAIKVIQPEVAGVVGLRRLEREARLAARLDHPGIARVYGFGTIGEGIERQPYLAMQFVEGRPLAALIRETSTEIRCGRAWIERVLDWGEQVARALHDAHEAGVVHRDVKPENVVVDAGDRAIVLDFGIATEVGGPDGTLTRAGFLPGSPSYMAPELLGASGAPADRRADVWSLGVLLFEALAGHRPFDGATTHAIFDAVRSASIPDLRRRNRAVGRELRIVVGTALERRPEHRYATALDLAEDLARVRRREPARARAAPLSRRISFWVRQHPAISSAAAILILALGAGLAASTLALRERTRILLEKDALLDEYQRLADVRTVDDLLARAAKLWPRLPEKAPAMRAWLAEAETVLQRRDGHQQALDRLRARALPLDANGMEKQEILRAELTRALAAEVARHEAEISKFRKWARAFGDEPHAEWHEWNEARSSARLRALESDPLWSARIVYEYPDARDTWRQAALAELVSKLGGLERDARDVAARATFAESLEELTLIREREAWEECLADLDADPAWKDLRVGKQLGLVPLGKDRDSRFWEFWVAGTGDRPRWSGSRTHGRVEIGPNSGVVLVLLPGGRVTLGSQRTDPSAPNYVADCDVAETPSDVVTLDPFFIGKYEVTRAQWEGATGSLLQHVEYRFTTPIAATPGNPACYVTWIDAVAVLGRWGLVLPNESQWEYAARGGTTTAYWTGADIDSLRGAENVRVNELADAGAPHWLEWGDYKDGYVMEAPVGSFRANGFGLYDACGNVSEWCADSFGNYLNRPPRDGDGLRRSMSGRHRPIRGGSFFQLPTFARPAWRQSEHEASARGNIGFRAARPLR